MRSVLFGAVFLYILLPVDAGDKRKNKVDNYERTSRDAGRLLTYRFGKLINEKYVRHNMSFDNETAIETTPNASRNEMVSFVNNSTQVETNGTEKVDELEHVADEKLNATMENGQGIKMDGFEENSTEIGRNGSESTKLIDSIYNGDGMVNNTMENVTGVKKVDFAEDLAQIEPSFLAQNEKSNEKYVKVEDNVLEFLNDATVNITVENNQLTLFVKDEKINTGEKSFYFCFKSTIQSYMSSNCPSGFCEVRIVFLANGEIRSTYIEFDKQNQTFGGDSITAVISENSMKVANVPKAPSPITTCNPDFDAGYLPVKVINKGGKTVRILNVDLYVHKSPNMDPSNYEMEMALVLLIAVGVTVASVIIISGVALIWSFYDEKAEKKLQEKMEEKQPSKIDKTKKVDAKPKTDAPIIAQK